jgi:hypothetical protein
MDATAASIQSELQSRFNTTFEVLVSRVEFASVTHFARNLICKTRFGAPTTGTGVRQHRRFERAVLDGATGDEDAVRLERHSAGGSNVTSSPPGRLEAMRQQFNVTQGSMRFVVLAYATLSKSKNGTACAPRPEQYRVGKTKGKDEGIRYETGPVKSDGCFYSMHHRWVW